MEKFAAMSGFGGVPSARANIGRLLAKISSEQETSGSASPTKTAEGDEAVPATPASKKKSGGRKRKTGESNYSCPYRDRRLMMGLDTATGDDAEHESPLKKKASPSKREGKAAVDTADQEEGCSSSVRPTKPSTEMFEGWLCPGESNASVPHLWALVGKLAAVANALGNGISKFDG
jgi:hypothetical protein